MVSLPHCAANGRPAGNRWNTSVRSADWGITDEDITHRAATARSNMFESKPGGTRYYYTDFAADGLPLNGSHQYEVTFPPDQLPPVDGFWSISLSNEHHFFHTAGKRWANTHWARRTKSPCNSTATAR